MPIRQRQRRRTSTVKKTPVKWSLGFHISHILNAPGQSISVLGENFLGVLSRFKILHPLLDHIRNFQKNKARRSLVGYIPLTITSAKVIEGFLTVFIDPNIIIATHDFVGNFIEWFGVLYGILLPLILVRVWEQLDTIDQEFDREADDIKIIYEDLLIFHEKNQKDIKGILRTLKKYVLHVLNNYQYETKNIERRIIWTEVKALDTDEDDERMEKKRGDEILKEVRIEFKKLIQLGNLTEAEKEYLVPELLEKINDLVDTRGDRISHASQRLFESLRAISLLTSIIFLIPFYFYFNFVPGLLDFLLVIGVTTTVVFIYVLIEDFDEPFTGTWRISSESWKRIAREMANL